MLHWSSFDVRIGGRRFDHPVPLQTTYGPAQIVWRATNGLDQPAPAHLTMTVSTLGRAWPQLNDRVSVEARADGQTVGLFYGAVSGLARRQGTINDLPATLFRVAAFDWRAVAARRHVSADFPAQTICERVHSILALAPEIPWRRPGIHNVPLLAALFCAPRLVSGVSLLTLLADTLLGADWIIGSGPQGLDMYPRPSGSIAALMVTPGLAPTISSGANNPNVLAIPAALVQDVPSVQDTDNILNRVELHYPEPPGGDDLLGRWADTSESWQDTDSIAAFGEMTYRTRTDVLYPTPRIEALQRSMHVQPDWRLEATHIVTGEPWPTGLAAALSDWRAREGTAFVISGMPDEQLAARIIGGTLNFGTPESMTLVTETWTIGQGAGLRFNQTLHVTSDVPRFNQTSGLRFNQTGQRFSDFSYTPTRALRFSDFISSIPLDIPGFINAAGNLAQQSGGTNYFMVSDFIPFPGDGIFEYQYSTTQNNPDVMQTIITEWDANRNLLRFNAINRPGAIIVGAQSGQQIVIGRNPQPLPENIPPGWQVFRVGADTHYIRISSRFLRLPGASTNLRRIHPPGAYLTFADLSTVSTINWQTAA